jgi:phage-related protein
VATFAIAEGQLIIDADTAAADRRMDGFFRDIDGRLRDARGRFAREGDLAGSEFGDGLERGIDKRGGFFSRLFRGIGSGISGGIGQLRELGSTIRDVGQVFSTVGGFVGGALKIGALAALVPIIIGVAAALSKLIGLLALLPGTVGVAVAAIAPLMVAFMGVGEALTALMSGDLEKLNEALKKLAPSARSFVREFGQILPMLRAIKRDTQEAFFAPLLGGLKELAQFTLPTIRVGMTTVAAALGRLTRGFMDLFAANDIVEALGDIFAATGRIIDRVGPSLVNLIGTFIGIAEHGLPFVERMFGNLANGMDKFARFLGQAMADGRLEKWLEGAFSVMTDLWELTKALGRLFGAIFGPTADEGQTFIQNLTIMTDKLTAFLKSAEGVEFLENLVALLRESKTWLTAIAATLIFLMQANNAFLDAIAATVRWFRELDDVIGGWLDGAGNALSGWFHTAVQAVVDLGNAIATFVVEKAAAFAQWLRDLPQLIANGLLAAGNMIAEGIGFAVGRGIRYVLDMPARMQAGWEMFKILAMQAVDAVANFFFNLPGRVSAALQAMWATVTNWFRSTRDSAVGNTQSMFSTVTALVDSLRGRIIGAVSGAAGWLRESGRNAIRGLVDGISDMLGWLIDRARSIGESVVRGFKRGLGIASPSKKMRDEVGKWILPGVVEGMRSTLGGLERFMGEAERRITRPLVNVGGATVAVGGPTVMVDLGDGVYRAVRNVVARDPQLVAAGTDEGRRQRNQQLGARAKS